MTEQLKQKIVDKVNHGQEKDVVPYTWDTLSPGTRAFWIEYFKKNKL